MKISKRRCTHAMLLLAACFVLTQPAQAKKPGTIHIPHFPSLKKDKPAATNPWGNRHKTESSPSEGSEYMGLIIGLVVVLAGGYVTLRILVKRAQADPDGWSPQAPVSQGSDLAAGEDSFEARMREKMAELEKFRFDAGFAAKPD